MDSTGSSFISFSISLLLPTNLYAWYLQSFAMFFPANYFICHSPPVTKEVPERSKNILWAHASQHNNPSTTSPRLCCEYFCLCAAELGAHRHRGSKRLSRYGAHESHSGACVLLVPLGFLSFNDALISISSLLKRVYRH